MTTPKARKPFARIVNHPKLGQIVAMVDTDSDGELVIKFIADTHPEAMNPSSVCIGFDEGEDLYQKLHSFTDVEICTMGEAIHNQLVAIGLDSVLEGV